MTSMLQPTPVSVPSTAEYHHRLRSQINIYLAQYYAARLRDAEITDEAYGYLWEALSKTHLAGGKRTRPYLALLTYQAFGGTDLDASMPACVSVELLHAAMLVHDDIIDKDYYRHGVSNVAGIYTTRYHDTRLDDGDKLHYAHSAALLGGDVLISDCFRLVTEARIPADIQIKIIRLLSEATYRVVGGELLDVEAPILAERQSDAVKIAELKTAFYSFCVPLQIGGLLAGMDTSVQEQLQEIGMKMGTAFQLADDMLGMYGKATETGKPVGNDLREGKRSLLIEKALERASGEQKAYLETALTSHTESDETIRGVQQILEASGARAEIESHMHVLFSEICLLIERLPIDTSYQQMFIDIARQSIWRKT